MKWIKRLVIVALLVCGGIYLKGRSMPREHTATSKIVLITAPDSVFEVARDFAKQGSWWSDLKGVQKIAGRPRESWEQDFGSDGKMEIEVTRVIPGRRIVTTILNETQQDWGGVWTLEIEATAAGTEVRITEEGWIESPFFRALSPLMGGHYKTMDSYLRSLGRRFGQLAAPTHG